MKMYQLILLFFLFGCKPSHNTKIDSVDLVDDQITFDIDIAYDDLITPYKKSHRISFNNKRYGIHSYNDIEVIDINGSSSILIVGGYVGLYSDQVEIRLLQETDGEKPVLIEYSGNGINNIVIIFDQIK